MSLRPPRPRSAGRTAASPPFAIGRGTFQLAALAPQAPRGEGWVYERKLDGFRAMADVREDGRVRLVSRNGLSLADRFPSIVEALAKARSLRGCVLDGEIVAYEDGRVSFHAMQTASRGGRLEYLAFDLLADRGEDLRRLPFVERKARLLARAPRRGQVTAIGFERDPDAAMADAERAGDEGILAKRADAPYRGGRSTVWQKIKRTRQDDFLVVGFTPSVDPESALGSLVLATRDRARGPLRYVGRVGTGFDRADRRKLRSRLGPLRRPDPPVEVPRVERRGVSWTEPRLVVRVAYLEETADGVLRHPTFRGEREDLAPEAVVRERLR